ncbi:MAG: hypothetical protein JWO58_2299 [Chitinophagaceae bacterium]|nr:hypothetical protein [Chitinophagaceae bacterium]
MKQLFYFLFFTILMWQALQAQVSCSKIAAYKNHLQLRTSASPEILHLMDQYDVNYYKIDVAAERTTADITGNGTIAATVTNGPLSSFVFELNSNITIDSLRFNNDLSSYTRSDSFVTVSIASPLANGATITALVYYHGTPAAGMFNGTEPFGNDGVTWTLSEPYSAYHWFPVKQILTDKADSVEVWVTTSSENKVGSNGLLKNTTALPNNKNRYEWKSTYPIAYYLISFTVAQFTDYTIYANPVGAPQPIPIVSYVYANPAAMSLWQTEIDKVPTMIEVYSSRFGLYPFHEEKYGHCTAPIGGGMEHQTMTTLNEFSSQVTCHELAHQWFGDQVTCATWKDIWLNEGFASYCEYIYHQTDVQADADYWLQEANNEALSYPSGSVYVDDTTSSNRIFDSRLTYKKGGLLLHMMRHEINDDTLFFQGMKNYQQTYKLRTATQADFQHVMETTTGKDFSTFFNQWYFGSGYPIFSATWNHIIPQGNFYLQLDQSGSDPAVTPLYVTSVECLLTRSGASDTLITIFIHQASQQIVFPAVQGTVTALTIDPNQWLINTVDHITNDPSFVTAIANEQTAEGITLFPNPATQSITLNVPQNHFDTARLYNAEGVQLSFFLLEGKNYTMNLEATPAGLYLIVLQNGKRQLRFIKE